MSITIGSENNFILDIFIYYQTLHEWKSRLKKMYRRHRTQLGQWKHVSRRHLVRKTFQQCSASSAHSKCTEIFYEDLNNNPLIKKPSNNLRSMVKVFKRFSTVKTKSFYGVDAVFEDMRSANNCNEEVERNEKSYIRERPKDLKNLKHSYSCDQISYKGEFTIKADILKRFSKKLIKHEKNGTKNLIEETGIGPEVKPPRNERRTLKLSKKDDKFGFLIEKYSFRVGDGNHEDRIFVSFVEDESSAYIGGLREGDVILKVNNENLEDLDFPEVKEVLKSTRDQLNLVVKFMDAINHKKLTERLKEKEATLAARRKSIERLDKEIEELKSGTSNGCSSVAEDLNEYTYDISDSGSVSSESSDDTHKNSSEKELYPLDDSQTECCEISILNETSADLELLDYYSEKKRTGSSIRRTESMPVQKNNSNLKNTLNSAKKKEEKYNISNEQTCVNTNFASEENETTNENYVPNSIHKAYRTKSYKRAVKRKEVV